MFALRLKRIAVAAGLLCALGTGTARAGLQVVGYPASQWGAGDAALGLAGYAIEDFEDAALVPNLLVGCESPAGNLTPTSTLPNVFNPTNDAYGTAFRAGVWDGSRCLVNTRDNQSHSYAESQHWGTMILEFPTPVRSVGFSVQQLDQDVRLFINGTELGGLAALSGLPVNGQRQGYVRIDATGTNTIAALRLTSAGSYDGWVIDHLALSTNPPPFQLTGFAPNLWATNDWALGVAGWFIEDFEDTNLVPHLLIGCETAAGTRAVTDTLPNLFNPTNDTYGTAFRGAPWTGANGLLNTRDNQSHAYSTTSEWGDTLLQFTVPMRAVAFSVQQMETDARLWINGVDYGGLLRLAGLTVGSGRQGYVRIDATGTNAITSIKIDNAPGDGFVLDHLACLPVVMPAPPGLFAWWTGDDTAEDCVGFFHGQLRNGASFAPGKVGKAFRLDGVDDFVEMPNVVKSNGAFSFAFWMKADAFTHDRYMGPFCQENGSTVRSEYKGWFYYTGNSSSFHSLGMQGTWTDETTLDGRVVQALQPGVWYHVVTTYDGVKLRQYLNGALRNEASYAGKTLGNPWPLLVGKLTAFPSTGHVTTYFHGLLDEIMFFNRSLSADEVAAVYAADSGGVARPGILPPAGLAAWWPGDGNADDVVGWNDGWLVGGTGFTNGLVDQAFVFDSDDVHVLIPHHETLNVSSNGFTCEFWMKADKNQPGTHSALLDKSHGFVDSTGWAFHGFRADGKLTFIIGRGGAGAGDFASVSTLGDVLDNQFHHIAGIWDRTNLLLYVDGTLQETAALTMPANNSRHLFFGRVWGNDTPQRFYRGLLDEVALYPRALSASEVAAIVAAGGSGRQKPACVAPPGDLVAWLPGEGNANDRASGLNGTTGGNVSFVDGRVGRAFRFVDSPDSYVTLPNSPAWLPANNQLTIAAWVKPDFTVTGDKADTILSKRDGCGTFSYHFGVMKGHRGMTGPLYFGMSGGVLGDSPVTSTPVPNDGQFHHVAVTFDGNAASENVRFYIDGQFAGSANGQQTIPVTATPPVMGKHAECGYYSSADMDEIAFFQRALSAQEIAALYTAGSEGICRTVTPLPPPAGQVAWWRAEGDARDTLGNHHGALQNGISFTSGVAGNGFALDGTNDCVIVPHAEALNIASNGFTVEFWMRGDKTQPGQANSELCLIEKSHGWVTPYAGWAVQVLTDGRVGWGVAAGGTSFPGVRSPVDVLDSQFHHIAGTYDGANITLYVDGQWQGSTNFAGPVVNNTLPVNIGFTWGGGTPKRFFRGTIDEVSIYQRALSAGEIRAILQAGALGKQPPVSVLPPGGQLAWWRAEGNSDDSIGANHGSLNGSAGFTNGMVGQCFRFNGGTDAVMLAPNALNQAFASVTFEAWVYPTQNGHNSGNDYGLTIFSTTDDHGLALRVKDGYLQPDLRLTGGDLKPVFTQRPVPLNQWSHVAFTYDGSQVRGYLNGQLLGSQAASGTVKTSANAGVRTCIGNEPDGAAIQSGGYGWRGWIDEPALYGRALRGEELAAIYASGSAGKRPPEYLTPPDGLVAWWRAENDGRDTAGGHHAVPQNGLSFTNGFVGQAFTLNAAATMHLRVTNRPALNPTNITLAAWVKPFSYPTVGCAILRKEAGATDQYLLQLGDGTTAGVPHFNSGIPGGWSTGTTPLPLNQWSHIVGTYNGRTACVYLNGLLVDSRTVTGPMPVTTHDLFIGRMEGDTQRNFDGLIDEAAIWNRGLSSDEVAALYAAGSLGLRVPQCAPPPDAMTHWFKAENRADDAVAGLVGALEGGAAFTAGRVGQAFSFDGVNDLVTYTNFPNLGTNSFSVSLWYRADTTSASAGNMKLVNKGMTIAGTPNNAGFQVRLESSKLAFTLSDSTSWIPVTCAEPGVGVWHHVAAIADRTNKLFRLYVDGSLAAQTNYTTLGSIDTNIRFAIGALDRRPGSTALAEFFNGLIDEVLFFDRPLTASEVASLHAAGSAGMCPTVSFDVTSAFGIANGNPNGVWSYGWMPTDFSAFNLYTHTGAASYGGGPFWNRDQNDAPPIVWKNIGSGSAWGVPPGWLSLHPGGGTEPSVIRWTAPATGVAHVVGRFLAGDGGVMQVAVRLNNQPWWNATDAGNFDLITNVTAGATVDFAVYGGYGSGNTPLEANITLALSETYPPTILVQPTNQVVTATRDVTLAVSAFGSEPLSYQWFFTNAPLAGATNAVLSFPLITTNRSGTYFVAVSNFVGAVTSQWAVLTVLPDTVGPAVTNFVPLGAVNTNVGRLLVQFNERINVDSFTTADVSVVTPRGALDSSAFTIQPGAPGDGTAFEVLIPSQSLEGDYAVRIGPFITDLAGNLMVGGSLFESQAFTSQPGHWRLLGQAAWNSGGFVRLTPATVQQKGSLVLTQALPAGPFVLSFDFRMSNGGGVGDEDGPGADGIALNFLPHVPGTPFFYGEGSNAPAFHLFLDSYGHPVDNPGDTNGDHIAIGWTATNASVNKAIQVKVPQRFIDTGLWHAEVEFDGAGLLTAHITSPTGAVTHVSQNIPAAAIPPQFYFGFGAYTGGGYADQDVDNILIRQLTADGEYRATFTIDKTGPSITSVSPLGIVSNTMTSFEVNLDSVYAASSISAADVTLSGPNAPAVQSVSSLSATSFRVTLAGPLPQGDFTITIGPEITDLAGNPMAAPFTANLTVFLPDLVVQNIAAPATALAGQPLNLTWTVTNRDPGNVTTAWKTRVQLATNAAGEGAVTLATFTTTNLLGATAALSQTGLVILPATAAGNRWLVVTADADNNVFENTETNNTLIAATPITLLTPDLALAGLGAPASAQFGQTISVNWAVTNVGTAPASASWSDRVYLSSASNSISGATPLATVAADASPLQSSAGYTRSTSVTLPFTAQSAPGTFWLVAFADYADAQAEANEANNRRSVPISLVLPPMPDLAVVSVTAPTNVLPNQAFDVSWTVTNLGSAPASGVWSETLMVSNTVTRGSAQAMFTFTNDLAVGASVSRTQAVTLPFSGPAGDLAVLVQLDSRNDVIESVEGNNVGTATNRLTVPLVLSLQLATSSGAEGTSGLKATVTRNGAAGSGALTVTITNSDDTELSTPANVIIPPEATTANFTFKALNDDLLDGPQTVTIGVSATGYQPSQAVFTVLDTNVPSLSLVLDTNVVREGQVINATVTRDLVTGSPLFVSLVSSSPSQLGVQSSVTIPAGEASASFLVFATDDSLVEASQTYEFAASAPGFNSALADVLIHDNDAPRITLTLAANVVSENAGPQAVLATVTRSPASAQPLTLQLESTNTGAARVPASVMFGAYQTNASFAIAAVNDALLDGTQTTEIRAWITDSITGEVLALGAAALLDVTDDDGPALAVAISPKLVKEGLANAANVTLSRNTPATNALTVHLSSSDVSEATVPATAVIPLNQVATTVPLTSVADGINDGNQTVVITASAPDYAPGAATVTVSDSDLPDLFVASISVPAAGETETYVNATYRVANQGFVPSTGSFVTRLYLSRDAQVGDDTLMGQYRFTGSLAPGQYFEQILPVRLPQTAGDYWVVVQTDAEGALAETLEDNNLMISATAIHAAASYSAYVQTTVTTALAGTPVPLTGRATNEFGVGVAYKLVNIHVQVRGTERVIAALTDADGNFSTTFQPLPNEAGSYQIFATHPGVSSVPAQDTFSLLGMKASSPGSVRLAEASSVTGTIVLENLSDVPLTGLAVAVTGKPSNVEVTTSLANGTTLGGRATKQLGFAITAVDATYTWGSIVFEVTSAEGAVLWIELGVTIEPMRPRLVTYPTELVAGMVRGRQTTVGFDVVNVGGRASGPIQVVVPVTTWLQVVSTNLLPSLEPGQTNHVSLLLSPPPNLPLAPYTGSLALNMTNGGLSVPFSFRAISDAKGDLLVTAVDEYTYYAEGAPRVTNAIVTVSDPVTHNPITNGLTDAHGEFYLPQITEGYYEISVSADKHQGYRRSTFVAAGLTNAVEAFLAREAVRYIWTVVPTQIEDRTRIVIETVFETVVPMPVVTVSPTVIDLADIQADETQIELQVSNHGLIAANNFRLYFDSHPLWKIEPLISDLGSLPANSTLTIPVMIRRLTQGRDPTPSAACSFGGGATWDLVCGKTNKYTAPVAVVGAASGCGGVAAAAFHASGNGGRPSGGGGGGGGGGGSSSGSYVTTVSFVPPTICDCDGFKEFCLGGDVAFEFGEIGERISAIIAKACPPTIKVQGVDVEINLSGEICSCCKDGNISLRGRAEGSASITVTLRGGLSVSGDLEFEAPGFTGIKAEADAMIGIELVVKGTVSVIFEQECLGKRRLCVGGSLSLTPFAGTKAMVDVQASSEYDALSWGGRCEMNVGVVGNIEAGIFGCSDTGFRAYGCGELGSLCNMSCALTAVDAFGNTLTNGFNGNADYPWINRSCSTSGPPPVVVSGPVRGPRGPRDPLPDLGTVFEDLPGDIFFKPEAEVMRKLGWNDAAMSGVCAQVKLRIDQEAVISRDAFKATLEVVNDSGSLLNNVSVDVMVQDANGANQTALFGLRPPVLTGISAVNGSGVIGPNSTGKAEWIIVPTSDAAPNEPLAYWVSGTLRYVQDGLEINVPLAPAPITVYPNPRLFVKYFHERNVYSDDPFTDVVEPSIPYNLAVMIENRGKGDARNVRITSAQPEIVDNERGLLIAFAIVATEVAGQNMTPSLTANFGTITNGQIAIGRWLLTSTLQGLFTDYKASFEHLDSLGNTRLSLIEEVTIHEMIHLVRAQGALDDGKFDFLVNAVPDAEDLPDTIFLSDGTTNNVEVVQQANVAAPPSAQNLAVQLTAPMPPGWVYLRVPDPGAGQFILKRVVRSDGCEIFFNTNAWTTDRTFIGFGRRPVYEQLFHLLDHDSTGVYTLHYELPPAPDLTSPVSSVAALPTDSRETFQVQWSGSDDTGDVAGYDVFVSANGGPFLPWLTRTKLTTASFQGVFGAQYAFYSVAVDAAGNREAAPITPDAVTTVTLINHPPVITPVGTRAVDEGGEFVLTPVVTDANLPDDLLVFSLVSGPPGLTLNPTTGEMRWLTSEAHGPSTNTITWRVRDSGVPQKTATDTFTLIVNEVNTTPTMGRLTNVTVMEGRWLNVTNTALDTDLPPQKLTWSLGAGAPAGVAINAASGLLTWKPTEFQGGTTNPITVIVRDNGPGSLAATQTFLVTVLDTMSDFFVGFGTTNVLSGASGALPLRVIAGVPLTNLSFTLTADEARLTNLVWQPLRPELTSLALLRTGTNTFAATLEAAGGNPLFGAVNLAELRFGTVPHPHSAVATIALDNVLGIAATGTPMGNAEGEAGRIFIIGEEPIASDLTRANQLCALTLYGRPGVTYWVQSATNMVGAPWQTVRTVTLNGTWERVVALPAADTQTFYRLVEVPTAPNAGPLTLRAEAGKHVIEWVPTRPNCALEEATALGLTMNWTPAQGVTVVLTNGVARVTLSPAGGTKFYRLRCD